MCHDVAMDQMKFDSLWHLIKREIKIYFVSENDAFLLAKLFVDEISDAIENANEKDVI